VLLVFFFIVLPRTFGLSKIFVEWTELSKEYIYYWTPTNDSAHWWF
jgi:hypothetical protein